jgi:prepilin-type N-terminal cleavage/methylation domain-containing protein
MNTPFQSRNTVCEKRRSGLARFRAGFTLLEILVATGVLGLMVTILFSLFNEGSNAWRIGEKTAEMNQGVRTAMSLIIHEASQAVIDTTTNSNLQGLRVEIQKSSQGDQPASDPAPYGVYEDLCFVAPVEIGNEATNNVTAPNAYRALCGVRYYVAKAPEANGRQSVLGNLVRVIYQPANRGSPASFYNNPWINGGGMRTNAAVLAENVLCFRVQPAQNDTAQGLKPKSSQMFKSMGSDQDITINYANFSGKPLCYPGIYIGLCVADSRLAGRINEMGLSEVAKTPLFSAATNWTLVRFENFKP